MNSGPTAIPYGKAVRYGNYKLWRTKYGMGAKGPQAIDSICVANLDETWKVQIPQTSDTYAAITAAFAGRDEDRRDKMYLDLLLTNFIAVTLSPSPVVQDVVNMVISVLRMPYLLMTEEEMEEKYALVTGDKEGKEKEKKMEEFRKSRKGILELYGKKRGMILDEYFRAIAEERKEEEKELKNMERDELADSAIDIMGKEEE